MVQTLEDEITRLTTVKMAAKIHSFDVCRHDDDDNVVKVTRSRGCCLTMIAINVTAFSVAYQTSKELHFTCLKSNNVVVLCE